MLIRLCIINASFLVVELASDTYSVLIRIYIINGVKMALPQTKCCVLIPSIWFVCCNCHICVIAGVCVVRGGGGDRARDSRFRGDEKKRFIVQTAVTLLTKDGKQLS